MGTWGYYAEHDGGHLNSALDDGFTVAIADTPPSELDELSGGRSTEVVLLRNATSSGTATQQESIDPNYRGQVRWVEADSRWDLVFCWHNIQRRKRIGTKEEFPTRDDASRGAEPLREWFRAHLEVFTLTGKSWHEKELPNTPTPAELREERKAIVADVVLAKREEGERRVEAYFDALARQRDKKYYARCAEVVLSIYEDRRDVLRSTQGVRALYISDNPACHSNRNKVFERATVLDFLCDVDIAARKVLTKPLHIALWRLCYEEGRVTSSRVEQTYPHALHDIHVILGKEFERRGISPTHEYFRPFNAQKI